MDTTGTAPGSSALMFWAAKPAYLKKPSTAKSRATAAASSGFLALPARASASPASQLRAQNASSSAAAPYPPQTQNSRLTAASAAFRARGGRTKYTSQASGRKTNKNCTVEKFIPAPSYSTSAVPVKATSAGPAISTRSSSSTVICRVPPKSSTATGVPRGQTPRRTSAATVAQAPVPQASVSPLPRSQTRILTRRSEERRGGN